MEEQLVAERAQTEAALTQVTSAEAHALAETMRANAEEQRCADLELEMAEKLNTLHTANELLSRQKDTQNELQMSESLSKLTTELEEERAVKQNLAAQLDASETSKADLKDELNITRLAEEQARSELKAVQESMQTAEQDKQVCVIYIVIW